MWLPSDPGYDVIHYFSLTLYALYLEPRHVETAQMATEEAQGSMLVVEAPTTSTGRRRRKNRFIKQGYHKSEREDARRVAARAFLSGIVLDSHLRQQNQDNLESINQSESISHGQIFQERSGSFRFTPNRPLSSMSRHSNPLQLTDDNSATDLLLSGARKLYELGIALDISHHHSPSKSALSKSFDRSSTSPMHPPTTLLFDSSSPEKRKLLNQLGRSYDEPSYALLGDMNKLYRLGSLNFDFTDRRYV